MAQQDDNATHWVWASMEDDEEPLYVGVAFDDDDGRVSVEVIQVLTSDSPDACDLTVCLKPQYIAILGDRAHKAIVAEELDWATQSRINDYRSLHA